MALLLVGDIKEVEASRMIVQIEEFPDIHSSHKNHKIVLTSGTFDLLHVGHLQYLNAVKEYGDIMVVLLSGDSRVRHRKGVERPIYPENERAMILDALKIIDYVILDNQTTSDDPFYQKVATSLQPYLYITDGPDPRFLNLLNKEQLIILPRMTTVGRYESTTAVINHIRG